MFEPKITKLAFDETIKDFEREIDELCRSMREAFEKTNNDIHDLYAQISELSNDMDNLLEAIQPEIKPEVKKTKSKPKLKSNKA